MERSLGICSAHTCRQIKLHRQGTIVRERSITYSMTRERTSWPEVTPQAGGALLAHMPIRRTASSGSISVRCGSVGSAVKRRRARQDALQQRFKADVGGRRACPPDAKPVASEHHCCRWCGRWELAVRAPVTACRVLPLLRHRWTRQARAPSPVSLLPFPLHSCHVSLMSLAVRWPESLRAGEHHGCRHGSLA